MLTVLETLNPTERAVFVLREVFDFPYAEIGEAIGKTPAAVRQVAHRAREHVASRRPRMHVEPAEEREVVEKFLAAITSGNLQELLEVLAPDVVAFADGGGVVPAARRPIRGAAKVVAILAAASRSLDAGFTATLAWLNGAPGVTVEAGGELVAAISLTVAHGRITGVYAVNNPHKLSHVDTAATLTR